MKKYLALILALVFVLALCAGCGAKTEEPAPEAAPAAEEPAAEAPAEGPTWADYQEYLIEKAGSNAPDLEEFKSQVYAIASWEDLDQTVSPWDQMFTTIGLSTWEEFQAGVVKDAAVMGSSADMASGEATAEPAAEEPAAASGEASAEPSDDGGAALAGSGTNSAHGGNGDTSEAAYKEYLKAWLLAEDEANESMTADVVEGEFFPAIDAGSFDAFPADMLFNGMLVTGTAMTYEQFVAAGGMY